MRLRGEMSVVLALAVLVAGVGASPASAQSQEAPGPSGPVEMSRLSGGSRFDTAVAISQAAFPDGADVVYVARADVFADALAAGSLTDGPVLLVPSCGDVPPSVVQEVARLDPRTVIALGGRAAVCDEMLSAVAGGRPTQRLAGVSRFATAVAISQRQFPDVAREVYLAAGDSPDAVAGGALTRGPIILVPSSGAPPDAVADEVARLDPARLVVLGGQSAVASDVVDSLAGGRPVQRLAGASRFETAAAIAAYQFGEGSPVGAPAATVYLARGDVFADAVAAGSLTGGPVLLVPSCGGLPEAVRGEIKRLAPTLVTALGGTGAVCQALLEEAAGRGPLLTDAAVVLEAAARAAMVTYDPAGGAMAFEGPGTPSLEVGDVIGSVPIPGVAPHGLLREVTAVTRTEGGLTAQTTQAALTDAIAQGAGVLSVPLGPDRIVSQSFASAGMASAAQQSQLQSDGFSAPLVSFSLMEPIVLHDADGDPATTGDQVVASGSFSLAANLNASIDFGFLSRLDEFSAVLDVSQSASLTVEARQGAQWSGEQTLWEATLTCLTLPVGPWPIVLCPTVSVGLNAEGEIEAALVAGFGQSASASFGVRYTDDGGWAPVSDSTAEMNPDVATRFDGAAAAKAGLRGQLEIKLYGVVGPYIYAEAYTRAAASVVDSTLCWGLYAGLAGGVGLDLSGVRVIGDMLPELGDLELASAERQLAKQPGSPAACGGGFEWSGTITTTEERLVEESSIDRYGSRHEQTYALSASATVEIPTGARTGGKEFASTYAALGEAAYRWEEVSRCDGAVTGRRTVRAEAADVPVSVTLYHRPDVDQQITGMFDVAGTDAHQSHTANCIGYDRPPTSTSSPSSQRFEFHITGSPHYEEAALHFGRGTTAVQVPVQQEDGTWLWAGSLRLEESTDDGSRSEEVTVVIEWSFTSPTGP